MEEVKKKWQDVQSAAKKRSGSPKDSAPDWWWPPPSDIKEWEKKVLSLNLHNLVIMESGGSNFIQNKICI